jgi:hypothetical protein
VSLAFTALTCPQCGGALPRQALWRMVACPYCRAQVTRSAQVVQRAAFREAHERAQAQATGPLLRVGDRRYRVLATLGRGEHADVLLAQRVAGLPERVTVKVARTTTQSLAAEADTLRRLQTLQGAGAAYFSQRLPQVLAHGRSGDAGHERDALVLRHPTGFWGSLAQIQQANPQGLQEVRHAVWLWRRLLEVLGYVHAAGWTHGEVSPEHALVHPGDHGVLLIGWSRAREGGSIGRDLMQSAWTLRALLQGPSDGEPAIPSRVPQPLADLLQSASTDAAWCERLGAHGIDQALVAAARAAFGPPQFIPFHPLRA